MTTEELEITEAQRKARRANGRRAVESGDLDRIRQLPQTKQAQQAAGRKVGQLNVDTGHLDRVRHLSVKGQIENIRYLPQTIAAQKAVGRKHAENGNLAKALHIRWHIHRGPLNPMKCDFCAVLTSQNLDFKSAQPIRGETHEEAETRSA